LRTLVVGATGYIGRAVVDSLLSAGHPVVALSRSAGSDAALRTVCETWSAPLDDLGLLASIAGRVERCIFAPGLRTADAEAVETSALRVIGNTLPAGAPLVYVSGSTVYGQTDPTPAHESGRVIDNPKTRLEVLAQSFGSLVPMIVRPGLVTGRNGGVTDRLRDTAARLGRLPRIGPVDRIWSTVDVDELARLCRFMVDRPARGLILNAARQSPEPLSDLFRTCCTAAGVGLDDQSSPKETLVKEIGPVAVLLDRHAVISPDKATAWGWTHSGS
jgi:nucleoside-diphosphate-sugar epimerase